MNQKQNNQVFIPTYNLSKKNVFFYKSMIQKILQMRQKKWKKLSVEVKNGIKATEKQEKRKRETELSDIVTSVIIFLKELDLNEGEAHANIFVHENSRLTLCNTKTEVIQLPSYFSKRGIYKRYYYERDWDINIILTGKYSRKKYKKREYDVL